MDVNNQHSERIKYLTELAELTIKSQKSDNTLKISFVNKSLFAEFESLSLSTIFNLYGKDHPFYTKFLEKCNEPHPGHVSNGMGILLAIKSEIEKGWLDEKK